MSKIIIRRTMFFCEYKNIFRRFTCASNISETQNNTIACNKDLYRDKIFNLYLQRTVNIFYKRYETSCARDFWCAGTDVYGCCFRACKHLRTRNFRGPSTSTPGRICSKSREFPPDSRLDFHARGCRARLDSGMMGADIWCAARRVSIEKTVARER